MRGVPATSMVGQSAVTNFRMSKLDRRLDPMSERVVLAGAHPPAPGDWASLQNPGRDVLDHFDVLLSDHGGASGKADELLWVAIRVGAELLGLVERPANGFVSLGDLHSKSRKRYPGQIAGDREALLPQVPPRNATLDKHMKVGEPSAAEL